MKKYNLDNIETLSDVFTAWLGGEPENTAEVKEFLQKSKLERLMSGSDVEKIIFHSGYFAPELVPAVYALLPPTLPVKGGKEKAVFAQTFYRMNNKVFRHPYSCLINIDFVRGVAVYKEFGAAKKEIMEKNKIKFRNMNYALVSPDAHKKAYERLKERLTDEQKAALREKARIRMQKYRKENPEKVVESRQANRLKQQKKTPVEKMMDLFASRVRGKLYREKHKDDIRQRRQQARAELKKNNPELLKEIDYKHNCSANRTKIGKAYYERHKEEIKRKAQENPKTKEYKRRYKIKKRLEKTGPVLAALLQGLKYIKQNGGDR